MPQDFYSQSEFTAPILKRGISGETFGVEKQLQWPQYYIDIHGVETAELRERIERLEQQQSRIVAIQNLNSDKIELKSPLVVTIEPTNQGGFVFWSEDLNTWGEGRSEEEAKNDFLLSLEELYFDLKQDKDKLGPAMERIWIFFQKMLKEV